MTGVTGITIWAKNVPGGICQNWIDLNYTMYIGNAGERIPGLFSRWNADFTLVNKGSVINVVQHGPEDEAV